MTVSIKDNPETPVPDAVRERLEALANKNDGRLTPDLVVRDATNPKSPLHKCFEWDDDKAANAYRVEQARSLIRSVRIVFHTTTHDIRSVAYIRDPDAADDEQGYISVARIRNNKAVAADAMAYELSRLEGILRRAEGLASVLSVQSDIKEIANRVGSLKTRVAKMAA